MDELYDWRVECGGRLRHNGLGICVFFYRFVVDQPLQMRRRMRFARRTVELKRFADLVLSFDTVAGDLWPLAWQNCSEVEIKLC